MTMLRMHRTGDTATGNRMGYGGRMHIFRWLSAGCLAYLVAPPLSACTMAGGVQGYRSTINIPAHMADAAQGTMLSAWGLLTGNGQEHAFYNCPADETVALITRGTGPLRFAGYVTNDGHSYAAYELSPTSPLLIFRTVTTIGDFTGVSMKAPITNLAGSLHGGVTPAPGNTSRTRLAYVEFAVVARGGTMTSLAETRVVDIQIQPEKYPSLKVATNLNMSVNVVQATCSLYGQTVTLADIPSTDLPGAGSTAGLTPFTIDMRCTGNGRSMKLTLQDANDTGNVTDALSPSPGSTAEGVRLQLLRDDRPVPMGRSWETISRYGDMPLSFAARYYRQPGPFLSGTIGARATLKIDYL